MTEQPWETHYPKCPNRRPSVAYPRHACAECGAYERGVQAAREAVDGQPHVAWCVLADKEFMERFPDSTCTCAHDDALAAIDAITMHNYDFEEKP